MKDKREHYMELLDAMNGKPILGRHTLGELTVEVTHRTWSVTDERGNNWSGRSTTGPGLRDGIRKGVRARLKQFPQ